MAKSLSLSIVAYNFFFSLEYSNFPQALALGTQQLILRRGGGPIEFLWSGNIFFNKHMERERNFGGRKYFSKIS